MNDINIRVVGRAGRITLNRPKALNALTYDMITAIENALDDWRDDPAVYLVMFDAVGDKAFCAGGDIADLYATGVAGDFSYGQRFWTDEYRLNATIFEYPKPVVSFLQGFTMGGGVGIGCHGSHRIVGNTARIAMPECGIGLVPDVGGSVMLALAPGRLGEYLGLTAARMDAADAIYAGFADHYMPEENWPAMMGRLEETGDADWVETWRLEAPASKLADQQAEIDQLFSGEFLSDINALLNQSDSAFAKSALGAMAKNAPLAMGCTVEIIHRLRGPSLTLAKALDLEYRFTYRAMEHGDFLEGIRAAIIDKDRAPKWKYAQAGAPPIAISKMLLPLGADRLSLSKPQGKSS
jgi:3-hydroxyisobutyrate dehydrogenase